MRYVPNLQAQLGVGIGAAKSLTEVFADNDELLDRVDDAMVGSFLRLIREERRGENFINFLIVLCQSRGKGVRTNQWRVCRLLVQEAPELLLHLKLVPKETTTSKAYKAAGISTSFRGGTRKSSTGAGGRRHQSLPPPPVVDGAAAVLGGNAPFNPKDWNVVVTGDPAFFPAFKDQPELELAEWLRVTADETRKYFAAQAALLGVLCQGRNLKNTPVVRKLLPYELVLTIICSKELQKRNIGVVAQFVGMARDMYVDSEPHEAMVYVKTVRIWENVQSAAESGSLSSRLTTELDLNWGKFDALKAFALKYVSQCFAQTATMVGVNELVLQLLMVLYRLIEGGFYRATELATLREPLLKLLDGRDDKIGKPGVEKPSERYKQTRTVASASSVACDTVVIMECKLWLCRILQLVCTVRLDVRLSKLLDRYRVEHEQEIWVGGSSPPRGRTNTVVRGALGAIYSRKSLARGSDAREPARAPLCRTAAGTRLPSRRPYCRARRAPRRPPLPSRLALLPARRRRQDAQVVQCGPPVQDGKHAAAQGAPPPSPIPHPVDCIAF